MVRRMVVIMLAILVVVGIAPANAQDDATYRNKAAVRELLAQLSTGNVDSLVQHFADPFRMNEAEPRLVEASPQDLVPFVGALIGAIPDLHITPKVIIAEGDWVVAELSFTGTFSQLFNFAPFGPDPIPPTNERVSWAEMDFLRLDAEGKIIVQWVMGDSAAMFSALGLVPPSDEANRTGTLLSEPAGYGQLTADALAATYTSGREATNIALFREHLETIESGGDTSGYYTEPYVLWEAGVPAATNARENFQFHQALSEAMPDLSVTPEIIVAEGDWVAGLVTISGSFTNDLNMVGLGTVPPTGQSAVWQLGIIHRYNANGKVVEEFVEMDPAQVLVSLGLLSMEGAE